MNSEPALAQTFFRRPPTKVSIHNPSSTEGQRNRTTIIVRVPEDAGAALESMVLSQLTSLDRWTWGPKKPKMYLGDYSLRSLGKPGLAEATISQSDDKLSIRFDPEIQQGQQVNVVFRWVNPDADIYQWATGFIPAGSDLIPSDGPTLRISIYRNDDIR